MSGRRLLLCTDLDRTLLPNGPQPESPLARERFGALVARPEVTLAYVTGRHRTLVEKAIGNYCLPPPDYVIGDVGTTIFEVSDDTWHVMSEWQAAIAPDWAGLDHAAISALFTDLPVLSLQEFAKQNTFKLSYYVPLYVDNAALLAQMQQRLEQHHVNASLIWSVDEPAGIGLLDVLPARATKLHAIEFLMENTGFELAETVFAGDSGNDLPVLASAIPAVLVANAAEDVREAAVVAAAGNGTTRALYLARGGLLDMNGYYSAGVLEGVVHYLPWTLEWIGRDMARSAP
jgi:HAD superfamily hydrolase (TIGR01484 family)